MHYVCQCGNVLSCLEPSQVELQTTCNSPEMVSVLSKDGVSEKPYIPPDVTNQLYSHEKPCCHRGDGDGGDGKYGSK